MPKWRNKVKIKHMFTDDRSNETVLNVANELIPQLEWILEREKGLGQLDDKYTDELEEIIENFKFVKYEIEHGGDATEYDFDSWCDAFNAYLEELYDLGDTPTSTQTDSMWGENFLWVG
jgi:hypothetical protein